MALCSVILLQALFIPIAERGTNGVDDLNLEDGLSEEEKELLKDALFTDLDLLVDGDNPQINNALDLTRNAIYKNPNSDIYVTGHSLGGFNAQVIAYHLVNKTLTKNRFLLK